MLAYTKVPVMQRLITPKKEMRRREKATSATGSWPKRLPHEGNNSTRAIGGARQAAMTVIVQGICLPVAVLRSNHRVATAGSMQRHRDRQRIKTVGAREAQGRRVAGGALGRTLLRVVSSVWNGPGHS